MTQIKISPLGDEIFKSARLTCTGAVSGVSAGNRAGGVRWKKLLCQRPPVDGERAGGGAAVVADPLVTPEPSAPSPMAN